MARLLGNTGGEADRNPERWAIVLGLLITSETYLAPGIFLFDGASEGLSEIVSFTDIGLGDLL